MLKPYLALFLLLATIGFAEDYPAIGVTRKVSVCFGQSISKVEALLNKTAYQNPSPIAREGKDRLISLKGVELEFDCGFLEGITFLDSFNLKAGIVVYKEKWKNFDEIDGLKLKRRMKKEDFLSYLEAWEARARSQGAKRDHGPEMLLVGEYSISFTEDFFLDMVSIGFGPERSTGRGGSWGDGTSFFFVSEDMALYSNKKQGSLEWIGVSCDQFNTNGRR